MELILDLIKNGKNRSIHKSLRFNKKEGVIGRSSDADYQLTDPQNYISGKHVFVEYKYGQYYLRDESSNGTFLKHPYKKLPKGVSHPISASEIYIIGDHELQVRFSDNEYSDDYIIGNFTQEPEPLEAINELIPDDDFLFDDPIDRSKSYESELKSSPPIDVLEMLEDQNNFSAIMEEEVIDDDQYSDDTERRDLFEEHIEVPTFAAKQQPKKAIPAIKSEEFLAQSLHILEEKLGIQIINLSSQERDSLMHELSDVIINALEGLRHSLYIKEKTKQDLRLGSLTIETQENNPVKLGKSATQLLENEDVGGKLGLTKLSTAISKSFTELDAHTIALHGASKNLMNIAISNFSPKSLEYKFESMGTLRGPMPRACQIWKSYTQMFDRLNDDPDSGVEMLAPHFTKEYEKVAFSVALSTHNPHPLH